MFLHLGNETVINTDDIIGIFDLETTTVSKHTRKFLADAEKNGRVINVSYELPKSFIVTNEEGFEKVYIAQLSAVTIANRLVNINLN